LSTLDEETARKLEQHIKTIWPDVHARHFLADSECSFWGVVVLDEDNEYIVILYSERQLDGLKKLSKALTHKENHER